MSTPPSRTVKAWVVVTKTGDPYLASVATKRRWSIMDYNDKCSFKDYHRDRRKRGVQVVRCTITTEPSK